MNVGSEMTCQESLQRTRLQAFIFFLKKS